MRNFFNVYFGHDFELNIGLNTLQAIVNVWMNDQNLSSRASANDGFYFVMEQLDWTLKHQKQNRSHKSVLVILWYVQYTIVYILVVILGRFFRAEWVRVSTSSRRVFADYFKPMHTDKFAFSQESRHQKIFDFVLSQ